MTFEQLRSALVPDLQGRSDVRFAVLFGSCATRGYNLAADVDLAVSFRGSPSLMELGALATRLERAVGKTVDVVSLDEASTLLRWEVFQTGALLVADDPGAWRDFQVRMPFEWDDLRPFFERESRGLRDVLTARSPGG